MIGLPAFFAERKSLVGDDRRQSRYAVWGTTDASETGGNVIDVSACDRRIAKANSKTRLARLVKPRRVVC
jgi:hypothetical protein